MTRQPPPKATNPKLLFKINSQIPPLFNKKHGHISRFSTKIDTQSLTCNFKMPLGTPPQFRVDIPFLETDLRSEADYPWCFKVGFW